MSGLRSWGNGGEVPILDKLESFVVNAFWLVAGRFFEGFLVVWDELSTFGVR